MEKNRKAFLSNRYEVLAEKLSKNIFQSDEVFLQRYIIVPNAGVKEFLEFYFIENLGFSVFTGVKIVDKTNLHYFFQKFFRSQKKFPSKLALRLKIENSIRQMVLENNVSFTSLYEYLQISSSDWSDKSLKRLNSLSEKLTLLFDSYGIYDPISKNNNKKDWQETIWYRIFQKEKWLYPFKALIEEEILPIEANIHCFGITYLPKVYHHFLDRLSFSNCKIYDYILSPCKYFWEDMVSDYEKQKIEKFFKQKEISMSQQEAISSYLDNRNSLLANFGKIARENSKHYSECDFEDHFIENGNTKTLLHWVQKDLLEIKNPKEEEKIKISEIETIQLHHTFSKKREVEVLFDYIADILINKKANEEDILILFPSVEKYLPYIQMVFAQKQIDYRITDICLSFRSQLVKGIFDFFKLIDGRWEQNDLIRLLENPAFQQKQKWTKDEVNQLKEWIKNANISWGIDANHRTSFIKTSLSKEELYNHTWEYGLERIIYGFSMIKTENNCDHLPSPVEGLEFSQILIFEKFLKIFTQLKEDFHFIKTQQYLPVKDRVIFFESLIEKYFYVDENIKEEKSSYEKFLSILQEILIASQEQISSNFSIKSIISILQSCLEQKTSSYNNGNRGSVHFTSYKDGIYPAKVICLMGMDEDFPIIHSTDSMDLMQKELKKIYYPKQHDIYRFTFLEALLSVREKLFISYSSSERAPSFLIQEFLTYLDSLYTRENEKISKKIVFSHPFLSFDKSCFLQKKKSLSNRNYHLAKAHYEKNIKKQICENKQEDNLENRFKKISVKELVALAKNPIKFYCNQVLGIYLEKELHIEKREKEDFFLSDLDRYFFRVECLKTSFDETFSNFQKQGKFPIGVIGNTVKVLLQKEMMLYEKNLKQFDPAKKDLFSIELDDECKAALHLENNNWIVPSIDVEVDNISYKIVGQIKNLSINGLISFGVDSWQGLISLWPEILIVHCIKDMIKSFSPNILMLKSGKEKNINIDDAKTLLSQYLLYYFKSKSMISYMVPSLSEGILLNDPKKLQKDMDKAMSERGKKDPYFSWLFQLPQKHDAKEICEKWSSFLQPIYSLLISKKVKK